MKIHNLDPKKYKRFFAFGCSFTNYKWPTWADIIGKDIELYVNWGQLGAGNYFIFNSVIEADARYNFTKDDLIIIFWSIKEREDRYVGNKWEHTSPYNVESMYGREWASKYYFDNRNYLIRDLSLIKATQTILSSKQCDWANLSWGEFLDSTEKDNYDTASISDKTVIVNEWRDLCKQIHNGESVTAEIDNADVIRLYQSAFSNIAGVYKWFRHDYIKEGERNAPDNDLHPMPSEALMFLDWVWPNNTLSSSARDYATSWKYSEIPMTRPTITRL
jgi:hypothetical protein